MNHNDVLKIYTEAAKNNITIWIDGGWCVDALLGEQTRDHPDLDIAVAHKDKSAFKDLLISMGFHEKPRNNTTAWNFVMVDMLNNMVDVHVFEYDESGNNVYGIEYPYGSLSGTGTINGKPVNCISSEWMFKFKTAYPPSDKDLKDVAALSNKFGFEIPESHKTILT